MVRTNSVYVQDFIAFIFFPFYKQNITRLIFFSEVFFFFIYKLEFFYFRSTSVIGIISIDAASLQLSTRFIQKRKPREKSNEMMRHERRRHIRLYIKFLPFRNEKADKPHEQSAIICGFNGRWRRLVATTSTTAFFIPFSSLSQKYRRRKHLLYVGTRNCLKD